MQSLKIAAIVELVVAFIAAIVVWTIVYIKYRKIKKRKKIDKILNRISKRAEDSGNKSDGDTEKLSTLIGLRNLGFLDYNNL
uniref:Protein Vpu n=1 Tax=Human immunodeficiency virus type 1 TaxID=11676 RepID=D2XL07_HV1|nr:vpu protein [Human immunodeficiency virus 1]